jgi:RimJ/RimL family protein N-acetyltransferase
MGDLSVFVAEFANLPRGLKPSRKHAPVADRQVIRYRDDCRVADRDFGMLAVSVLRNGQWCIAMTTLKVAPNSIGQKPIGDPVNAAAAGLPAPVNLVGRFGQLVKLDAERHSVALWDAVKGHDQIWTYMAYGPFTDDAALSSWIHERAELSDPYSFAVLDRTSHALGIAALMAIRPSMRVIEVGNILLSPALQRKPLATEIQYLLARYVFETLGYRRYEWKCDALNAASRRAALRFGFTFEGVFRQHMIVKGRNRDTAWFAMLDSEWPQRKLAFERWLAPDNFDDRGQQRASLGSFAP